MMKFPSLSNRLSLGSFTIIASSIFLIATPALAQTILTLFLIGFHTQLSLESTIGLLSNMWWINLIPKVVGLTVLVAVVCKSRLRIDSSKLKRQLTKASVVGILGLFLVGALYIEVPIARAETIATTGYILDTPLPIADWYIGKYSTNNYFAINGSNWDNLMAGVGSTAWSSYTSNYTKIEELVLGQVTSGIVYTKEVPFDLALMNSIPRYVSVVESVNGLQRTFINPLDSQGSPYTISVSGVNYFGADKQNQICFTSTNATLVGTNAVNSLTVGRTWKETVLFKGTFVFDSTLMVPSYTKIILDGKISLSNYVNVSIISNKDFSTTGNTQIELQGGEWDGNQANELAQSANALYFSNCSKLSVHGTTIHDSAMYGLRVGSGQSTSIYDPNSSVEIYDNVFYNNRNDHVVVACSGSAWGNYFYGTTVYNYFALVNATQFKLFGNTFNRTNDGNAAIGIEYNSYGNTITGNTILNAGMGIQSYASGGDNGFNTISFNNIIFDSITYSGAGYVGIYGGFNDTINGNTIKGYINGTGSNGVGIVIKSKSTITNNEIVNCLQGILTANTTGSSVISGNRIAYELGGSAGWYGIYANADNLVISGNLISGYRDNSNGEAIVTKGANNLITGNRINNCRYGVLSGSDVSVNTISNNDLTGCTNFLAVASDTKVYQNNGYNPVGYLANPFTGVTLNMLDTGNNATMTTDFVYTICNSAKIIYVSGGTVTAITVNGQATGLTSGTFTLQPTNTFSITFSSAPTLKVMVL
jgi:hypothetical protein